MEGGSGCVSRRLSIERHVYECMYKGDLCMRNIFKVKGNEKNEEEALRG